jgi:hypothetical protein
MTSLSNKHIAIFSIASLLAITFAQYISPVRAAGLTSAFVRFDRMSTSQTTGGRVCATPTTLASTETSVVVTFPASFSVNSTASNWTITTTNLDTGQTAWPGIGTATTVAGQSVTFPSGDLTLNSTLYCFNFNATSTLTTPGSTANNATGTITTRSAGGDIDSSQYATSVISNDQIVVTASVGATFTFALSGNSDNFGGNLDPALVNSTTGRTVTLTTNAAQGWIVWAKDSQNNGSGRGSLRSTAASKYIAGAAAPGNAARTMTPGTEDYGLGVTVGTDAASGGTVTINSFYDGSSSKVGTLDPVAFRPIASANGTAAGDIINLVERATISTGTPAASDYTDTITVVGAGQF